MNQNQMECGKEYGNIPIMRTVPSPKSKNDCRAGTEEFCAIETLGFDVMYCSCAKGEDKSMK